MSDGEPSQPLKRRRTDSDRDSGMEALLRIELHERHCEMVRAQNATAQIEIKNDIKDVKNKQERDTRQLLTAIIAVLLTTVGTLAVNVLHLIK